jgi:hypothetical protein
MQLSIKIQQQKECLTRRVQDELERLGDGFELPVHLDLTAALCLVGNLQLALRHPGNTGPSAQVARMIIDGVIARMKEAGYLAHAEVMRLGDDPSFDLPD